MAKLVGVLLPDAAGVGKPKVVTNGRRVLARAFRESEDGVYYVTATGNTLHVARSCGFLWGGAYVVEDPTKTLSYRVRGGDAVRGPTDQSIFQLCYSCTYATAAHCDLRPEVRPAIVRSSRRRIDAGWAWTLAEREAAASA